MRGGYRQNAGRKKGFSAIEAEKARELITQKLSENLSPIIDMLIEQAKKGDIKAVHELFDRAYGKPAQESFMEDKQVTVKVISFDPAFVGKES